MGVKSLTIQETILTNKEEIVQLIKGGMKAVDVARKYGFYHRSFTTMLVHLGIRVRPRKHVGLIDVIHDNRSAIIQDLKNGRRVDDIADDYKINRGTFKQYLRMDGVFIRKLRGKSCSMQNQRKGGH